MNTLPPSTHDWPWPLLSDWPRAARHGTPAPAARASHRRRLPGPLDGAALNLATRRHADLGQVGWDFFAGGRLSAVLQSLIIDGPGTGSPARGNWPYTDP